MRAAWFIGMALAATGCLELGTGDPSATPPSPTGTADASKVMSDCRAGQPAYMVLAQHHPGFTTYEYQFMLYVLEDDGDLYYVRANEVQTQNPGTGQLYPEPGAYHNVSAAEVKTVMQRLGVYKTTENYNVTIAWRDRAHAGLLLDFCRKVLDEFYEYEARYELNNVADGDAFTFKAFTKKGEHQSYSYAGEGPQGVRKAFEALTAHSRAELDIDERY